MGPRDLGALVLLSALWGASFIYFRVAVPALGPFVLVELRVGLAAVVLALCAALVGRLTKLRRRWRQFVLLGVVNSMSAHYVGQYYPTIILLGAAALTMLIRPRGLLGR